MRFRLSISVVYSFVSVALLAVVAAPLSSQTTEEGPFAGPDAHEHEVHDRGHLFGDWSGERQRLLEHGFQLDVQYVADHLSNIRSDEKTRLTSWNRFRGTADLDLGRMGGPKDVFVHVTALWQAGGILGQYLGLVTSPSGMSSGDTFRLDSWWLEKRFRERIAFRVGQFAGQDFYGSQHFASSFIFEPMGYALSNLSNTYETFDPPSTPAAELRVSPAAYFYIKSMVMAGDRFPYAHNPTGLAPQFRGAPVSASEIGFTLGKRAASVRAFDTVEDRRGYSGLYQFGATYNPGKFAQAGAVAKSSGNELLYLMASQSLYRTDPVSSHGLDVTASIDWSPAKANPHNRLLTAGLRWNEPLPIRNHNTVSIGYVQSGFSSYFPNASTGQPLKTEYGAECNLLLDLTRSLLLQPVLQYYAHAGGTDRSAVVLGFRSKIDF